eukprot:TRINITY_DN24228_c0_g1_i1.p1 TRINITY_DN24228_c0_g1~~TRINITY_DN24228_c0_g1_i1.p1  ORF type:complete len:917 (-),score=145.07 TRINITY_DN24228_c0_g1_i1:17-2743(-)
MVSNAPRLPGGLESAIVSGHQEQIRALLSEQRELLNGHFSFRASNGRLMEGSPLAAAMRMHGRNVLETVKLLVDHKADLNLPTSFLAGSSRVRWEGPPLHDAIGNGSLELVKFLIDKGVSPSAGSSLGGEEGASPLWQASFQGFAQIASFLLDKGATKDLEVAAPWQDAPEQKLTPLHVAARQGYANVVSLLIDAKAEFDKRSLLDQAGSSPLRDAIDRAHVDVVKLLVAKDATVPRQALFALNNEVTIAAVAEGLSSASISAVQGCLRPAVWLGMFLKTPGSAPARILHAIFRPRDLKYFDDTRARHEASIAYFSGKQYNFAEGIDFEEFDEAFRERAPLGEDGQQLLADLCLEVPVAQANRARDEVESYDQDTPADPADSVSHRPSFVTYDHRLSQHQKSRLCCCARRHVESPLHYPSLLKNSRSMAPAKVLQCVVPDILQTEQVLHAIAYSPTDEVYDLPGCEVLISLAWDRAWWSATVDAVSSIVLAILFACVTAVIRNSGGDEMQAVRNALLAAILALIAFAAWKEFLQLQGMYLLGKLKKYLLGVDNFLDWCRISCSFAVAIWLLAEPGNWVDPSLSFSVLLAFTSLFRWFRVLATFRGYELVGEKTLAIEQALLSANVFLVIAVILFCGFTNVYFALSFEPTESLVDGTYILYQVGFLADLGGLEDKMKDDLTPSDAKRALLQLLAIVGALAMAIVMMNIFIGVLSESYSQAYRNRQRTFQRERARIAFSHSVRNRAQLFWMWVFGCHGWGATRSRSSSALNLLTKDTKASYLWYCLRQSPQQGPAAAAAGASHCGPGAPDWSQPSALGRLAKLEAAMLSLRREKADPPAAATAFAMHLLGGTDAGTMPQPQASLTAILPVPQPHPVADDATRARGSRGGDAPAANTSVVAVPGTVIRSSG